MPEEDEIEPRVAKLEDDVRRLRERAERAEQDAAAARILAGGADRDVSDLGGELRSFRSATTLTLNAMRDDLNDVRTDLDDVRTGLTGLRAETERGFADIRGRLDATAAGQEQIAAMLRTLIDREAS